MSSVALASLTATYTDSEGEDEASDINNSAKHLNIEESLTPPPKPTVEVGATNPVARLVSYNDDMVMSEDDHDHEIVENDNFTPEKIIERSNFEDVELPPEPTGRCSNELQEKIVRLHEKMEKGGLDMNYVIQQRKDFRNPSIYEKLIQFCSINEFGTNYPAHIYDPLRWGKESYYEELAKAQKAETDRREKERKEKTKVEFVVGTAKRSGGSSNPGSGAEDDAKKRKSKWDQVGAMVQSSANKLPGLVPPSTLTSSATGTKGTVISAFGSLPKKPRV